MTKIETFNTSVRTIQEKDQYLTVMIYLKTDYATIQFDERLKLVELEWHGLVQSHEYRETLDILLDLIEDKKLEYALINRLHLERISLADEEWRKENWYPRFLESNIKRSASVISKDYYTEISVSRLIEEEDKDIRIQRRSFCDYDSAKQWLLQFAYIEVTTKQNT